MSQTFRVLLVEDDDSLRTCLDELLSSFGWSVRSTAFGAEAIQFAQQQRFDFSILDFHLPGTTGLEVWKAISAIRPLPAILMSGMANQEEAAAAQRAGVFTFLRKPLELERLRTTVQLLIHHHFGGPLRPVGGRPRPGHILPGQFPPGTPPGLGPTLR